MEPTKIAYDICRHYLHDQTDVNSALISTVGGYHRSRNLAELTSCSSLFDWHRHTVNDWRFLRQVESFFKKNSAFQSGDLCEDAARKAFYKAEEQCLQTNLRLDYFYVKRDLLDPDLNFKLKRMERYVNNVLGDYQSFLDAIPNLVRVTPGATAHSSRRNSLPQLKLKMKVFATSGASSFVKALYRFHGFKTPRMKEVKSNRIELVPKNWKTDRTIACEPEGNLPFQLAFDTYAKRRLRRFGIDLRDQSANQKLAKHGSIHNDLVTVDFTAASDTISYNTVAWMFPWEWLQFLDRMRSPEFRGKFGRGKYQKFSSMGNGCTFTIETLLFAAACYAVGSKKFKVYGDDVIIERELYEDYIRLTRFLGFTINEEKSFHDGPFRESCGSDYFNGIDVTPVYLRGADRRKATLCHLVNSLASIALPGGNLSKYFLVLIKKYQLPMVPYSENTQSGIWIFPDRARDLGLLKHRAGINKCKIFVPRNKRRTFIDSRGYYLWFLNKNSQVLFAGPWDVNRNQLYAETSWVPVFEHAYVRRWVTWQPPRDGTPDHLYWWSDQITAQ